MGREKVRAREGESSKATVGGVEGGRGGNSTCKGVEGSVKVREGDRREMMEEGMAEEGEDLEGGVRGPSDEAGEEEELPKIAWGLEKGREEDGGEDNKEAGPFSLVDREEGEGD